MTIAQKEKHLDIVPWNSRANDEWRQSARPKGFAFSCLAPLSGGGQTVQGAGEGEEGSRHVRDSSSSSVTLMVTL